MGVDFRSHSCHFRNSREPHWTAIWKLPEHNLASLLLCNTRVPWLLQRARLLRAHGRFLPSSAVSARRLSATYIRCPDAPNAHSVWIAPSSATSLLPPRANKDPKPDSSENCNVPCLPIPRRARRVPVLSMWGAATIIPSRCT
jgi:hypothetical protein